MVGHAAMPATANGIQLSIATVRQQTLQQSRLECGYTSPIIYRQDCQPRPNSQRPPLRSFLTSSRLRHFPVTVKLASEMHFNAVRYIAQPNTTHV